MRYDFNLNEFTETGHNPEKMAVAGSDVDYSWIELKKHVEDLAAILSGLNIPTGEPVIIYGHKEALFPVAMLACYLAEVTYTPVDRIYPEERVRRILSITAAKVMINCTGKDLPDVMQCALEIRQHGKVIVHTEFTRDVQRVDYSPDYLQYIMFTSGSTGEPKGVQILRSSVNFFANWAAKDFGFDSSDVFLNQAPFTFDVSLCDVLNAFSQGGTLVLTDVDAAKDQNSFLKRVRDYGCTVWTSTPSFAFIYLRHPEYNGSAIPSLKTFLFMGEELPSRTCTLLRKQFPSARVLNAYGPTEATIVTTLVEITPELSGTGASVPIGYPMPGSTLLIDNGDGSTKEGELIICGPHVSAGYYNREDLNEKKFFLQDGQRAFRTGDLAYYEGDLIYFLGRNDDQIKLHGYRIELDEISAVLCDHMEIDDAVTVPLKRGNEVKKIISFVKMAGKKPGSEIREAVLPLLSQRLPYYMIPAEVIVIADFPYNVSHKIDRNRLIESYLSGAYNN